jgi:hypothetical protein
MHLAPKQVTAAIARLVAEARAAGIHLILATQHPSAKTVTPPIRANVPARLVFKTETRQQSQAAIDVSDAMKLLGKGDGLFRLGGRLDRIHCSMASDEEVDACVTEQRRLGEPAYALTFDGVKPLAPVSAEDDDDGDELGDMDQDGGEAPADGKPIEVWLRGWLKANPDALSTDACAAGKLAGFHPKAVSRAADNIGVVKTPAGMFGQTKRWGLK